MLSQLNPDGGENSDKSFVADEKSDGRWEEFLPTLPATLDELKEDELEKKCSSLLDETTKVCGLSWGWSLRVEASLTLGGMSKGP